MHICFPTSINWSQHNAAEMKSKKPKDTLCVYSYPAVNSKAIGLNFEVLFIYNSYFTSVRINFLFKLVFVVVFKVNRA